MILYISYVIKVWTFFFFTVCKIKISNKIMNNSPLTAAVIEYGVKLVICFNVDNNSIELS